MIRSFLVGFLFIVVLGCAVPAPAPSSASRGNEPTPFLDKRRATTLQPSQLANPPGPARPAPVAESVKPPAPARAESIQDRWAVVVGISEYRNSGRGGLDDLLYARQDAEQIAEKLTGLGWSRDHIRVLLDDEATFLNVQVAIDSWLTKAGENDLILFYWSGHGFPDPSDPTKIYFVCHDTDPTVPATGHRMDRVRASLEEKGARNVVVLADTCHAGKLITRDGLKALGPAVEESFFQREPVPPGWLFMVGADVDRTAVEHTSWSNGAFTRVLLEALSGEADGYQSAGVRDGVITAGEVREYLRDRMPEETQRVLGRALHPTITTTSGDPGIWQIPLNERR